MAAFEFVDGRCNIDLPMISSPTRFITVSMRAASTRSVFCRCRGMSKHRRVRCRVLIVSSKGPGRPSMPEPAYTGG